MTTCKKCLKPLTFDDQIDGEAFPYRLCAPCSKKRADRWRNDAHFVVWLLDKEYAFHGDKGKLDSHLSDGVLIFMWEAWCAGRRKGERDA